MAFKISAADSNIDPSPRSTSPQYWTCVPNSNERKRVLGLLATG